MNPAATQVPRISVIIPTTCEFSKRDLIERAIKSVLTQEGVSFELLVVVNGNRPDTGLLDRLRHDQRLSVHCLEQGHVSQARLYGLQASGGEYFTFLDDDDEYLPRSLQCRVNALRGNSKVDVLVTNGYMYVGSDRIHVPKEFENAIRENPGMSFLARNWFASPSATFRRASFEYDFFDIPYKYFEWTYLFFRLLSSKKNILYIPATTFRKHEDRPGSVSKTREYKLALPAFLIDLMRLPLEQQIRIGIRRNYIAALNQCSNLHLQEGDIRKAFLLHFQCLRRGGWQFLPYSRRILFAALLGHKRK